LRTGQGWPWRDAGQVVFGDSLLGGQPTQQAGQLDAFALGQGGADLVLVVGSGGLYLAERVLALRGQVQRVGAPVGGCRLPCIGKSKYTRQAGTPARGSAEAIAAALRGGSFRCQATINGAGSRPSCRPAGFSATYGTPAATPLTGAFWSRISSSRWSCHQFTGPARDC